MANNVRIVLNRAGVAQLLKSPEVEADLLRRAQAIASAASASGGEFVADSRVGATRARAIVFTGDAAAEQAEATDRALTRAIDAGR